MKNSPLQFGRTKTQMLHKRVDGIGTAADLSEDLSELGRQAHFQPSFIDSTTR